MYRRIQELHAAYDEIFNSRVEKILKTGNEEILNVTKAQTAEFYEKYKNAIDLVYTTDGSSECDLAIKDLEIVVQKMRKEST
jgi:hypothetical protein